MTEQSKIEWTDHTFSPWRGCAKQGATRVVAAESSWRQVERWNRRAAASGGTVRVFPSLCDPFEQWNGPMVDTNGERLYVHPSGDGDWGPQLNADWRPLTMADVRARFFRLIDDCPHLTFQLLTKRPENVLSMWPRCDLHRSNVHLYASCSTQADVNAACETIALAGLNDLCPVRGLSLEPLLQDVASAMAPWLAARVIQHVIVGGESGPGARPCSVQHVRSILRQCREAGVPVFIKQAGSNSTGWDVDSPDSDVPMIDGNDGYLVACFKHPKGGEPAEWPDDLRVREMP